MLQNWRSVRTEIKLYLSCSIELVSHPPYFINILHSNTTAVLLPHRARVFLSLKLNLASGGGGGDLDFLLAGNSKVSPNRNVGFLDFSTFRASIVTLGSEIVTRFPFIDLRLLVILGSRRLSS